MSLTLIQGSRASRWATSSLNAERSSSRRTYCKLLYVVGNAGVPANAVVSMGGSNTSHERFTREGRPDQLLLCAYQAPEEQVVAGRVTMHIRSELLDIVIVNGRTRGIVTRDLLSGQIQCHAADVVVLAAGGYSNVFYLSTNARASNCTAIWRAHRRGALFGNPRFTQIHPTCSVPFLTPQSRKFSDFLAERLERGGRFVVVKFGQLP